MAGEIQVGYASSRTLYALIRNTNGLIWSTTALAFQVYNASNLSNYAISLTEQGSSGYYIGNFPSTIVAGTYNVIAVQQLGGSPAESDPRVGDGSIDWNGTAVAPLSDAATSGQVGQFLPTRFFRGQMIKPFVFPLVSSTDHVTPFTSGVCSGMYSQDGSAVWTAFASGAFAEMGGGFFSLQAIVSGEMVCNSLALRFLAAGISGGLSDQRSIAIFTQKTSGQ